MPERTVEEEDAAVAALQGHRGPLQAPEVQQRCPELQAVAAGAYLAQAHNCCGGRSWVLITSSYQPGLKVKGCARPFRPWTSLACLWIACGEALQCPQVCCRDASKTTAKIPHICSQRTSQRRLYVWSGKVGGQPAQHPAHQGLCASVMVVRVPKYSPTAATMSPSWVCIPQRCRTCLSSCPPVAVSFEGCLGFLGLARIIGFSNMTAQNGGYHGNRYKQDLCCSYAPLGWGQVMLFVHKCQELSTSLSRDQYGRRICSHPC